MKGRIWKIVGLLSIVIFMLSTAASAHAASLTTTIATHVTPVGVVYDPAMHEIFVSNYDSGDIQVISDSTNTQVADITALTQYAGPPYNLAYDSGKGEIWVADATGAYAISDATNQVVANVTTNAPSTWGTLTQAAYDPKTGEVFVCYSDFTGASTPYIQVISDSSNTVIANITQAVTGIVDDSAKSEIFAPQYLDSSGSISGNVYVISAQTNAVTATIPLGGIPGGAAYDSVKGEIFVANSIWKSGGYSNVMEVISDSTNKIIATVNLPTSASEAGPMAYNPDKGEIYINDGASVAIISDKTNNVVGTVDINGTVSSSGGIAYDSGTSTVYAINNPGSTSGSMGSLAVISDPSSSSSGSSPTSTATPSTGTSATASPATSPTVPEFSSPALAFIAAAFATATLCTVAFARKKQHPNAYK